MSAPAPPLIPHTLEGHIVRLEPLALEHLAPLARHAFDEDLWRWTVTRIRNEADLRAYIDEALVGARAGTALPFVTRLRATGEVIGSTRFGNYDGPNRRVEIGW